MKTATTLILSLLLCACGGGDGPPDRYILVMETTAHASEFVYVYETEQDCVGAGSYRVTVFPDKYLGFACKAV